uniref:Anion transporter SULP-6 (projected from Caenorhabditis elegans ortholog sulp-6) n=1 Tax=Strongyloides venezuelensis TaxID=75913 RepID=A0A0K0F0M2_STRVS
MEDSPVGKEKKSKVDQQIGDKKLKKPSEDVNKLHPPKDNDLLTAEEMIFPSWIEMTRREHLRDNNPMYNFASVARRITLEKKKGDKKMSENIKKSTNAKQNDKKDGSHSNFKMTTARSPNEPKQKLNVPLDTKVMLSTGVNKLQVANKKKPSFNVIHNHPFEKYNDVFTQEEFDKVNGFRRINLSKVANIVNYGISFTQWNRKMWINFFHNRIPLLYWLPRYNFSTSILMDITAGFVIAVMSIPQGLAYGMLVGLPPIHGLYTSVIGPFMYVFFGSSKHVSPGAFSIIALMVGNFVEEALIEHKPFEDKNEELEFKIKMACGVTFFTGVIQVLLGIVNAGLFAVYLSDPLIKGLTSGAAIHVLISQIKGITGVDVAVKSSESFGFLAFWIYFFSNIKTICWQACLTSILGGGLLIFSKEFIDKKLAKCGIRFKFPMEMIVVALSTVIVFLLYDIFKVDVRIKYVGKVDHGMRAPEMLDLSSWVSMLKTAFFIAIVCFVIHFALAKTVAKMDNQQINVNQEWLALGLMNVVSSFFGCFAGGASMSRTITQYKLGSKSQLSTLVSVLLNLVVIYGGSKFLFYLPRPILSVIVMVALKDLLCQLSAGKNYWEHSIIDFLIWLVTLLCVLFVDVESGFCAGIIFSLLTVVFRTQWAESYVLGRIPGTSIYKGLHHYRFAEEVPGIKIFRYDAPLYYANTECFLQNLYEAVGIDPIGAIQKVKETVEEKASSSSVKSKDSSDIEANMPLYDDKVDEMRILLNNELEKYNCSSFRKGPEKIASINEENQKYNSLKEVGCVSEVVITHLVIDCSSFPYVDIMGKDVLIQAYNEFKVVGIKVFYAGAKAAVRQSFERTDFYSHVPKTNLYVSIADAVAQAQNERCVSINKQKHQ